LDDSTRSASAQADTVSGLRGATARAMACATRAAAGARAKLAEPSGMGAFVLATRGIARVEQETVD